MTPLRACLPLLAACLSLTACQRTPAPETAPVETTSTDASAPATSDATAAAPLPAPSAQTPMPGAQSDMDAPLRSGVPTDVPELPADTPTPPLAEGAAMSYTCEDGSVLSVSYAGNTARLGVPGVENAVLSRTPAAGTGEGYAGGAFTLLRLGNIVELDDGRAPKRRCVETGGNA